MTDTSGFFGGDYHGKTLEPIFKIWASMLCVLRRCDKMHHSCSKRWLAALRQKLSYRETAARESCHRLADTMKWRRIVIWRSDLNSPGVVTIKE
jgi:hypothetical protein